MKHYRIRAVVRGNLLDSTVAADNGQAALKLFSKKAYDGEIKVKEGPGFYQKTMTCITYEEVDPNVTTRVGTEKTQTGASMGQPSVRTEANN
jgi:hypothetical protein